MFVDTEQYPFTRILEGSWGLIRDDYLRLPRKSFDPWVQREMYGEGWSVYGFYAFGTTIPDALAPCPATAAALSAVPGLVTAGFSRLAPGTHITPHVGWVKTVYRLHLGLVVPPECAMRVGSETRPWEEGRCVIFDDTVEHEAWNRSGEDRGVLLLDFLRPGYSRSDIDVPPPAVRGFVRDKLGK